MPQEESIYIYAMQNRREDVCFVANLIACKSRVMCRLILYASAIISLYVSPQGNQLARSARSSDSLIL